jgi:hypothetical protein
VPSVDVSFQEPSRGVCRGHAGAINRDRTLAGYAGLRAAITKTAEFSPIRAFVNVYDALGDVQA